MSWKPATPLLLGHRGARLSALENTPAAFDLALEHGCDGFEFDVRCTHDGHRVVCHDPEVGGVKISTATRAELPGGSEMPTLELVLQRYAAKAFLDIELKVSGMEEAVFEALRANPPRRGYVVSSFIPAVLSRLKQLDESVPCGWICDNRYHIVHWNKLNVEYLMPQAGLATPELIEQAQLAGRRVVVWTVNVASEMRRLAAAGVNGIISDDTEMLARTFKTGG